MTPGNNGASPPEDDDPFGYLYADGQANGAQPPSGGGYGYPNSVSRVRAVGERQYGQPQQQTAQYGQYGQPQQPTVPQQGAYGQPNAPYGAPESFPGGPGTGRQSAQGGGRGRGPNTKGLLIGAVAVVAAVVVGIAVAMANGDSGNDDNAGSDQVSTSPSASTSPSPSESSTSDASAAELPTIDAKALRLDGGAALASDVEGAQADGGIYVGNLNQTGASVTWTVNGIPSQGTYTLFAHFSATGDDQSMTLSINGKTFGSKFNLGNFAHAEDGDFAKGWTQTYSWPTLTKGTNTISLSCQDGDKCNVLLDQLWLKAGQVKE
ncbi:carbohydrate-binding protein [Streptomyces sp. NBC_01275]|uniref:carbohydrate-binding protein n=1 Tax=Streptomyces sp. NBC_01275 TaxID=2903807 RepID=UPI002254853E|nr:carbohydrate-binding protein [Streptomyces sp. NBC_01275]MCX4763073.1 carbohydrate-binding protein [Streptomyces sp. NBC_01275]